MLQLLPMYLQNFDIFGEIIQLYMQDKKILIIAPYAFGYTNHMLTALHKKGHTNAKIVYLDFPSFAYKNSMHKAANFLSKVFSGKNLKKEFVRDRIKNTLAEAGVQDFIFMIRPDMLDDALLEQIKKSTRRLVAYYYDSTRRFTRKNEVAHFFDKVYTYDRLDAENHGYEFLTNYIFKESEDAGYDYQFFNISTYDYRYPLLEKLGNYLKERNYSYLIEIYTPDDITSDSVQIIHKQKSVAEVEGLIKRSKIIVEIQRTEQLGLSFRIFEALGYRKKLITTNKDIVNYDFYNPQNILVIDENNIEIPEDFVTSLYIEPDKTVLDKYRIDNWVERVFEL
ncbi:hypothetical protein LRS05_08280 [Flavobacterium sp. J372]|uniref:hypothetical protein n=1 Tax=Flavobacterium sp. J372 TaxID=2898436 RepID=UPI00215188AF|nr:hypothetical protein [Flavobacterium sp. J372]MCR5862140.1 hypothetical protein [Flavobacterium sp. J372]